MHVESSAMWPLYSIAELSVIDLKFSGVKHGFWGEPWLSENISLRRTLWHQYSGILSRGQIGGSGWQSYLDLN